MSGPLVSAVGAFVAQDRKPYLINQSLRFSTNEFLTRTNSSGATDGQYGTLSVWYKMDSTTAASDLRTIIEGANGTYGHQFRFYLGQTDLHIGVWGSVDGGAYSNAQFRDDSAWYHFLWQFDKTQSGVTNVNKLWVNGVAQTQSSAGNFSSQNWGVTNNGSTVRIGHYQGNGSTQYARLKGYIAEMHVIDGSLKAATDFAETDTTTGAWIPKKYIGSYGTNGFYLKFDPTSTNGIGHDHSGNGNNFTANNFVTSGTGTDVMSDTPTTNWCTLNPLDKNSSQLPKDGNLYFDGSVATGGLDVIAGTIRVSSGKYYWESTITNVGSIAVAGVGITKIQSVGRSTGGSLGGVSGECAYLPSGNKNVDGTNSSYGSSFTTGDTIGVALDCDAGTVTFYKNNTSQGAITYAVGGGLAPAIGQVQGYGAIQIVNFGQRAFAYTPPTGYKALNTQNLPEPTIKDGGKYFSTLLYNGPGNSSAYNVTGVGFQPDFVWMKNRGNGSAYHRLWDAVRGADKSLISSLTDADDTVNARGRLTAFISDGFTTQWGSTDGRDVAGLTNDNHVAWNWKAGGAGSSNNSGSITSTVSANASAGFSIVTYTGTGANATVGHGLGVAPKMIIVKQRNGTFTWRVYHGSLANTQVLYLSATDAATTETTAWNSTSPASTVFSVGTSNGTNGSSNTYVAYCFSEVAGYSKFGSYTGNGSTDGPFVFCGFRPAWVLIKRTGGADDWFMYDTTRDTYNEAYRAIDANTPDIEKTSNTIPIDILSNGFKIRSSGTAMNGSGETIIFAAFAEIPFKYANAR